MHKGYLFIASLFAALGVALGAFGAHGLKKMVPADTVATFQTGVQYQMYHSLALMAAGILYEKFESRLIKGAGIFFISGILLFSGSLYAIALFKAAKTTIWDGIGIITPVGGLCFIVGWILILVATAKKF